MKIKLNDKGKTLAEAAKLSQPCGGMGKCGKCRVKVSGALSPPTARERELLGNSLGEWRLACQAVCLGECSIHSDLTDQMHRIIKLTDTGIIADSVSDITCSVNAVVDIGTTTLEAALFDANRVKLASVSALNPQRRFGADVITRIGSAAAHASELALELRQAVAELVGALINHAGMDGHPIRKLVVTGNTVMLHFFAGLDTSGMKAYPFTPQSLFGKCINPSILREVSPDTSEIGEIYLPSCVSAFIGADMICAIFKAKPKPNEVCFVVDIGTNGEMALITGESIVCASTAAGPALEGAEISCGMRAEPGAIDSVRYRDGKIVCTTIGDEPARGICGSGLVMAAAALLDAGLLTSDGYLAEPYELCGGVYITQEDIRKLQLAKAAIRAGIEILLGGKTPDRFCIAGNFGSHLDLDACRRIGLIPDFGDNVRIEMLGNAALDGAALLLDEVSRAECTEIAKSAKVISLEDSERFTELFVDHMLF
jgi:uncharacterized 2Fe-2S/4Fe-4S cluster protein (DUF4445 family)